MVYLFTRYFTYLIQFITSIIIAVKLGPYYFGIWGFILLLINYFQITNFGISNSINILMVQYKNDENHVKNYVATSFILIGILSIGIVFFALYYRLFGISLLKKYEVHSLIYFVCIIAVCAHLNNLFLTIYRVKNSLFEIAFYQSIIPVLIFIALICAKNRTLLMVLLGAYLIGHIFSFVLFIKGKLIPKGGIPNFQDAKIIIKKGFYLFIYNLCFYLIIVSTRTIISIFYKVEEFGFFTFSFTLANSIMLFLDALTFIIFPKLIDQFLSDDKQKIEATIKSLRTNYVSLTHGLIYFAMIIFPVFLSFIPKYQNTLLTLNLIALTIVLSSNFFGYNSYLMAQNQDKTIAKISLLGLFVNVSIALCLAFILHVSYQYIIFATMLSYFIFSYLYVLYGRKFLNQKITFISVIQDCFPYRLLIPYISAILIILSDFRYLLFLPFIIFLILNFHTIKELQQTIKKIILKPDVININ